MAIKEMIQEMNERVNYRVMADYVSEELSKMNYGRTITSHRLSQLARKDTHTTGMVERAIEKAYRRLCK